MASEALKRQLEFEKRYSRGAKGSEVCEECGWHKNNHGHEDECSPKAGRAADALARKMKSIPSTKLGYGFGRLTFEFAEDRSITLQVHEDGSFSVDSFHWLGRYKAVDVGKLLLGLVGPATAPEVEGPDDCCDLPFGCRRVGPETRLRSR